MLFLTISIDNKDNVMEFKGNRIILPWANWQDVEISPEGIYTGKGLVNPRKLDLLIWKANCYHRRENRVNGFMVGYSDGLDLS